MKTTTVSFSECLENAIIDYVNEFIDYDFDMLETLSNEEIFEDFILYTNYFEDKEVRNKKDFIVKRLRREVSLIVDEVNDKYDQLEM